MLEAIAHDPAEGGEDAGLPGEVPVVAPHDLQKAAPASSCAPHLEQKAMGDHLPLVFSYMSASSGLKSRPRLESGPFGPSSPRPFAPF